MRPSITIALSVFTLAACGGTEGPVGGLPTGENQTFARAHRSMLGVEPDLISAFAYDAMRVGRHLLLSQQRHTPEAIQQGLQELAGFRGLLGKFHVTNDGDIGHEPALLTIEQGQFSLLPAKP